MEEIVVKDCNGTQLSDGDSVVITKTLKVKGMNAPLKKGQKVKNIRLTDNPKEVDCRVNKTNLVIKTEFLKKSK